MSVCTKCGFDSAKQTKPENRPWINFDLNRDNFPAFKLIVERTLSYARLHDYVEIDKPEMMSYLGPPKRPLPFDMWAKFNVVRSANITTLYSILEFFHKTKKCPKGIYLRDTKIYSRLEKLRNFCAHIIDDDGKLIDVLSQFHELDVETTFTKVAKELFVFVADGIDEYLGLGMFKVGELENSKEGKMFLRFAAERRAKRKKS